jgi:hypothetical protein
MPVETIVIEGGTVVSNVRLGQKRQLDRAPATFRHPFNGHYQTDPIGPLGAQEETHAPQQCAASDQASEQRYDSLRLMRLPQAKGHGLCIGGFEGSVVCINNRNATLRWSA